MNVFLSKDIKENFWSTIEESMLAIISCYRDEKNSSVNQRARPNWICLDHVKLSKKFDKHKKK